MDAAFQATDTIAAIATPQGEGGIAVVRISGSQTLTITDRVFSGSGAPLSQRKGGTFTVGYVVNDQGERIDQVLALIMRAPHSYTCEDVVELQGHGGSQCARRILRCVLEAGARMAQPGEFTQRAFLHGRLDLVQAEAVLDLIHAKSGRAAAAAMDQLQGGLSQTLNTLYDQLIAIAADLEATLDFPEDELPETVMPDILGRSTEAATHLDALIQSWDEGHWLRDGARVVISGQPNVGKSTLLNGLLETDRAIVSNTPGTTRDTIEEDLVIAGIPIRLVDTAGLRETDCEIEQLGIARTRNHIAQADLHIYVLDATRPVDAQEINRLSTWPDHRMLLVVNKVDRVNQPPLIDYSGRTLSGSATQKPFIQAVRDALQEMLASRIDLEARPQATISERHRALLRAAQTEFSEIIRMLSTDNPAHVALASSQMRMVLDHIGLITGRTYHEELLNTIFSRFCIGK